MSPARRLFEVDPREFGISALFAAVVLFVAAMAMLGRNVEQLRESFADSERSAAVLRQIDQVHINITGTELTVRGFALSGDPVFVSYHKHIHKELVIAMTALGELVRDTPDLQADFVSLEKQVAEHEAIYTELLADGAAGRQKVAEAITNPAKRRSRGAVLALLVHMDAQENALLTERRQAAEAKAGRTFALAIGIAIFAFVAGTIGFALTFFGRGPALRRRS
ncbi:MAG: CHASE3 domain-containing protein [Rhizomicrobium sp.]|nr:CHASE3 domain-containing protein [Rhizomicrobium sp.]